MNKNWMNLWLILAALTMATNATAAERIISFHSDIEILTNGDLHITETIKVNAEGSQIKRGIYRDLPTTYPHPEYAWLGFKSKTPMVFDSVKRDGDFERHHTRRLRNGVRYYFGNKKTFIKKGEHTYEFSYFAERQINEIDGDAVLYWNVTGNDWQFTIEKATARVQFPAGAEYYDYEAWSGLQGSTKQNVSFNRSSNGALLLSTNQALGLKQGLTLRVKFDKAALSLGESSPMMELYQDNKVLIRGASLIVAMPLIFLILWLLYGIDPKKGIIVAQYRPLKNVSAAAHRAFHFNKVDNTSFAVGLLSAGVKGWITIEQLSGSGIRIRREERADATPLTPSEQILVDGLLSRSSDITIGHIYDSKVEKVKSKYTQFLKKNFASLAHKSHQYGLILGALVGAIGVAMCFKSTLEIEHSFHYIFIAFGSMVLFSYPLVKSSLSDKWAYTLSIMALSVSLYALYSKDYFVFFPLIIFSVVLAAAAYLLPAPKQGSRKSLDDIEGFRLYLSKAEHESLKRLTVPTKTPQLYEELLPFAVALDLETEWSDQFVRVLAAAKQTTNGRSRDNLSWYSGGDSSTGSLASGIVAGLASSVAAASTPPSSSSSGGGSGGGGGGGGGGGW